MKPQKLSTVTAIITTAFCIIGALCSALVLANDELFTIMKYSIALFIFVAVGFIIFFFMDSIPYNDSDKADKLLLEKDKVIDALSKELSSKNILPEDVEKLQKKCQALEDFRNSFPYRIADGYIIYNIIRIELMPSFSKWLIVGTYEGELWSFVVNRAESQKYKEMITLVADTKSPMDLKELNQSENLFWE